MYKIVLNQYTIGLILLFSSCFASNAQAISGNSPTTYIKSAHPPPDTIKISKKVETDTAWKPVRRLWGYTFGNFYYNAHADASNRGAETNYLPTDHVLVYRLTFFYTFGK